MLVRGSLRSRIIMEIAILETIKQPRWVVKQLRDAYPRKKFTLDGRLVGDLGEVLAKFEYGQLRRH